jgi:hypothetical protein
MHRENITLKQVQEALEVRLHNYEAKNEEYFVKNQ